jgi:hypothetical protein
LTTAAGREAADRPATSAVATATATTAGREATPVVGVGLVWAGVAVALGVGAGATLSSTTRPASWVLGVSTVLGTRIRWVWKIQTDPARTSRDTMQTAEMTSRRYHMLRRWLLGRAGSKLASGIGVWPPNHACNGYEPERPGRSLSAQRGATQSREP